MKVRHLTGAVTLAASLLVGAGAAWADEHAACDPDPEKLEQVGTIEGSVSSMGLMVGARWGEGTLTVGDVTRRFDIIGVKALETGVSVNDFTGEVYNLNNIEDFIGTYYGASTKLTVVAGEGEGVFNNARCVVLAVKASGGGLQLSAPGSGGVEISWDD